MERKDGPFKKSKNGKLNDLLISENPSSSNSAQFRTILTIKNL